MVSAQFCAAWMGVPVRFMAKELHTFQVVFLTMGCALLLWMPWAFYVRRRGISTTKLKLFGARSFLEVIGFSLAFTAMTLIPLPQVTSLQFLSPIFLSLMTVLILKEEADRHVWLALAGGFLGMLFIIRPGFAEFSIGSLMVVGASLCFGTCGTIIRVLSRTESTARIVFYMLFLTTPLAGFLSLFVWITPSANTVIYAIFAAIIFCSMQYCVSKALALAPATTVTPFAFFQLLFVSLVAYVFFGEVVTPWTVVGACVILGSAMYSFHRARRRAARISEA